MSISRRNFIKIAGAAGAATGLGAVSSAVTAKSKSRVVVIGGGYGGATAAKYIKKFDSSIDVTLVEANKHYYTCPGSNWILAGLKDMSFIKMSYDKLAGHGVNIVHDTVTDIDAANQVVHTKGGQKLAYDRCIVSPGVDFKWDAIAGYDEATSHKVPHAWKAGPQTELLHKQLLDMKDGGTFVIAPPPNPFRCPPGPAERISMVAHYFKTHKPNSKIVAVDPKGKFSKQGLFVKGWKDNYGFGTDNSMITYHHNTAVEEFDAKTNTVVTGVEEFKGDVVNIIPAQKAGHIAQHAGLADDSGWCPVNHMTSESTLHKNIHVIGDAAIAAPLPKSGYAANSLAKVCAAAVVDLLNGREPGAPSWVNTCYSLVAPGYGISVAMVYDPVEGKIAKVKGSGGLTPMDANRAIEAVYAESWMVNIQDDIFG